VCARRPAVGQALPSLPRPAGGPFSPMPSA